MSMDIYFDADRETKMTPEEGGPIFSGAIRIPLELEEDGLDEFFNYWLKWLTEITRVLVGAEWNVSFADVPALWDEETGWRVMTDEEYGEFYGELL